MRPSKRRVLGLALLGLPLAGASAVRSQASVTFDLVPEAKWQGSATPVSAALPDGIVYLYRQGEYEPALTARAGAPVAVPVGDWGWLAESEGYVTVEAGFLSVGSAGNGVPDSKHILWPVAPACAVELSDTSAWQGYERLDIVSVARGSVYPVASPQGGMRRWIPVGAHLAYSVSGAELYAISRPASCGHGASRILEPPSPPAAGEQNLLVTIKAPAGTTASWQDLVAGVSCSGVEAAPSVATWTPAQAALAFYALPARGGTCEMTIRHPELRTVRRHFPAAAGSRELRAVLRDRRELVVDVDYQPLREHATRILRIYYCGLEWPASAPSGSCRKLDQELTLTEGLHSYRLENLDDGAYVLEAQLGREVLPGLGQQVTPFLDPATDEAPYQAPVTLEEFEIYGHLIYGGEPVAGFVHLEARSAASETLRFATDDDLEYHMYYFGRLPWNESVLPPAAAGEDHRSRYGLFRTDYLISACSVEGACRAFHRDSAILGGGRLDFDLGSQTAIRLEVRDATSGKPVSRARAYAGGLLESLDFVDGKVSLRQPRNMERTPLFTDDEGRATARDLEPGPQYVRISKDGYQDATLEVAPVSDETLLVEVELEPEASSGDWDFLFDDGTPVANAGIVVVRPDGQRDLGCSSRTDHLGKAALRPECLEASGVIVIHRAVLRVLHGGELLQAPVVRLRRAPEPSVVVRLVDTAGMPVAGAPIELRFRSVTVGSTDLLAAASLTGQLPFFISDSAGRIVLRGVDPNSADAPTVAVEQSHTPGADLYGVSGGSTVELTVELDGY